MTPSYDYDLAMINIVIASTILIILTWPSCSSDHALDYDIAMIVPWINLWIFQSLGLWILIWYLRHNFDIMHLETCFMPS